MMARRTSTDLSSRADALEKALAAESDIDKVRRLMLMNLDETTYLTERTWRKNLPDLLRELANLPDSGLLRFLKLFGRRFPLESPESYLQLRDELRAVWKGSQDSGVILNRWLAMPPQGLTPEHSFMAPLPFHCSLRDRKIVPNCFHLRGGLVMGVLEHLDYLKVCSNPDCAAPYFIAKRKDQRVCEAGDCKAAAQRIAQLAYWNEKGKSKRDQRVKGKNQRKGR